MHIRVYIIIKYFHVLTEIYDYVAHFWTGTNFYGNEDVKRFANYGQLGVSTRIILCNFI